MKAYQESHEIKLSNLGKTKIPIEQKVMGLLQWVEINQKPPPKISNELFSDGSKIDSYWCEIKYGQKIDKPPYDQVKSNPILMKAFNPLKQKLKQKVMELLQWVEINQKPPSFKSNELFSDGCKIGIFWSSVKYGQKIDQPPYDQLKSNPILMDAYNQQ